MGRTRAEKYRRLKRQLLLYRGISDRSSVSDLDSNATRGSRDGVRGSETYMNVGDSAEVPVSIRVPATVMASEVIPSFPITTMAGTMSRSAEGFVTVSELAQGVTTSRITPSTLAVPPGLALAYGYANISYTEPRVSFQLPDPIFPPMRLSRVSGETAEEDALPGMMDIPPSEEHRGPRFRKTVRGGQDKLHSGRDFSPMMPNDTT